MSMLLRLLGFQALAALGRRLPPAQARAFSLAMLLVANLLPIVLVLLDRWRLGDVFALYWIENVVVWLVTIIKIATAKSPDTHGAVGLGAAAFFAFHFGLFTFVHGVFTAILIAISGGLESTPIEMLIATLIILGTHLATLALNWFGREERVGATVQATMMAPYPRMAVLHVSVILAFFFMFGMFGLGQGTEATNGPFSGMFAGADNAGVGPVLILCGLKTVLDLAMFFRGSKFTAQLQNLDVE